MKLQLLLEIYWGFVITIVYCGQWRRDAWIILAPSSRLSSTPLPLKVGALEVSPPKPS